MTDWLSRAFTRDVVLRSVRVGVIVGVILTAINYGDLLLRGDFRPDMAWKIPMTFLVPYCVSTYACVASTIGRERTRHPELPDAEIGKDP